MIGTDKQTNATSRHANNNPNSVIVNMPAVHAMPAIVVSGPRNVGSLN